MGRARPSPPVLTEAFDKRLKTARPVMSSVHLNSTWAAPRTCLPGLPCFLSHPLSRPLSSLTWTTLPTGDHSGSWAAGDSFPGGSLGAPRGCWRHGGQERCLSEAVPLSSCS